MEEQKRRRRGDGCIYLQPGSPFYMMKFVYHGKVYVKSSERDEEHAAYTALQNWRSKIVSGTTSPGEHRVKVSELWDDVVAEYHALQRRDTDGAIQRWNRNLKPFFGNMRATDVTDEKVREYVRKRQTDGSARGQVKGSTIGRELNLLRRCYKLGLKGNPPKVRAMPLIPRFKDNKRTGTLEFDRHDDLAEAYRTLGDRWHVPLEAVFETAYTFGWRHGEITPLKVRQFRDVSPTEAWLHLDADTTKNMEARVVPLGSWCVRLIAMLRELVKGKQPDDLIFTRGLNHRPVQRFDKLWRRGCRMAGVNESLLVHDLRRTAAQRMLDGRDSGAAHHANLRLEDHVDVPPLRDDGTQRAAAGTREARRV